MATVIVAAVSAFAAALLPIALLGDLVSLGTICVFIVVSITVIWLRNTHPELERPFKVPFGGIRVRGIWLGTVPLLALASCAMMAAPVLIDITDKARSGEWVPAAILLGYIGIGAAIYLGYGMRHAHLGKVDAA